MSAGPLNVGVKLRHARTLKHLRLRELAARVGCSESLLSKIENGRATPSLHMLHRIVSELGVTIGSLLSEEHDPERVVLRASERPTMTLESIGRAPGQGIVLECLIPHREGRLLFGAIHIVEPGGDTHGTYVHEGEEVGYVLAGEIELVIGGSSHRLRAGDSFYFPSDVAHGYRNPGAETARILWINTPPTF